MPRLWKLHQIKEKESEPSRKAFTTGAEQTGQHSTDPSASYGTHCSVCPRRSWTTEGNIKESWWTMPFLFTFLGLPSTCLRCLHPQQQSKRKSQWYLILDHWMIPSWSSFVPPLLSLKCCSVESPCYMPVPVSEPLLLLRSQQQLSHRVCCTRFVPQQHWADEMG